MSNPRINIDLIAKLILLNIIRLIIYIVCIQIIESNSIDTVEIILAFGIYRNLFIIIIGVV